MQNKHKGKNNIQNNTPFGMKNNIDKKINMTIASVALAKNNVKTLSKTFCNTSFAILEICFCSFCLHAVKRAIFPRGSKNIMKIKNDMKKNTVSKKKPVSPCFSIKNQVIFSKLYHIQKLGKKNKIQIHKLILLYLRYQSNALFAKSVMTVYSIHSLSFQLFGQL